MTFQLTQYMPTHVTCTLCFGRGYRCSERPNNRPGVSIRSCRRCRGVGSFLVDQAPRRELKKYGLPVLSILAEHRGYRVGGKALRSIMAERGYRSEGPAFYQLMCRLEDTGMILSDYEKYRIGRDLVRRVKVYWINPRSSAARSRKRS